MQNIALNTFDPKLMQSILGSQLPKTHELKFEDKTLPDNFASLVFMAKNTADAKSLDNRVFKKQDTLSNINKDGQRGQSTYQNDDGQSNTNNANTNTSGNNESRDNPFYKRQCFITPQKRDNKDLVHCDVAHQDVLRQRLFMQSVNNIEANASATLLNALSNTIAKDVDVAVISSLDLLTLSFITKALSTLPKSSLLDNSVLTPALMQRQYVDPSFIPFIYFMFMKIASVKKNMQGFKKNFKDKEQDKKDNKKNTSNKDALMSFLG